MNAWMISANTLLSEYHFALLARTVVSVVLIVASIPKLAAVGRFAQVVRGYQLLPTELSTIAGRILPVTELAVGLCLLLGILMPWTSLLAAALFILFATGIAVNLLRGRRHIPCGCFGPDSETHLSWRSVFRSAVLAALALMAVRISPTRPFDESMGTVVTGIGLLSLWWLGGIMRKLALLPSRDAYFGELTSSSNVGLPNNKQVEHK